MEITDLVCPNCGLACDDLTVTSDSSGISIDQVRCQQSVEFFKLANLDNQIEPQIAGRPVSLEDAVAKAAELLQASLLPLITGLATDVSGARAAMLLADKAGACIDHEQGDAIFRNTRVVQDSGWFTTTLTEVRNRADVVVLIGDDIAASFPRLYERIFNASALFTESRHIVAIGPDNAGINQCSSASSTHIPVALEDLPRVSAALRLLFNNIDAVIDDDDLPLDALRQLAQQLKEASYSCIAWKSSSLNYAHAELTVEMLSELVRDINVKQRGAGLPLGGGDGTTSVNHVCTWQSGFPLRTDFSTGTPHHDWWKNSGARRLADQQTDLLLWLSDLSVKSPPSSACPQIVIGHPATALNHVPEVFIPTGIPGVDQAGMTFRMDSVVALPLRALREPRYPSMQTIVESIVEATL